MENQIILSNSKGSPIVDLDELIATIRCNEKTLDRDTPVRVFLEIAELKEENFTLSDFSAAVIFVNSNNIEIINTVEMLRRRDGCL